MIVYLVTEIDRWEDEDRVLGVFATEQSAKDASARHAMLLAMTPGQYAASRINGQAAGLFWEDRLSGGCVARDFWPKRDIFIRPMEVQP